MGDAPRKRLGRSTGSYVLTPPTGVPVVGADADPVPTRSSSGPVPPAKDAEPPVAAPAAGTTTTARSCVCGHEEQAHEHWRPGRDCGACGAVACPVFRRRGGRVRRFLRRIRLVR